MSSGKNPRFFLAILVAMSGLLTIPPAVAASKEKVLHSFKDNGKDGYSPVAGLVFDSAGNLYGIASAGGAFSYGMVFQLSPGTDGGWNETILHSFQNDGVDGTVPTSSLVFDSAGNLYGTTAGGGANPSGCNGQGCGTVFELLPGNGGKWTERILYSFAGGVDGAGPYSGVVFDSGGNLYGTTQLGGAHSLGTAFQLTPDGHDNWSEKVLYSFKGTHGRIPSSGLVLDSAGNLYGTTEQGGTHTVGVIFELSLGQGGKWTEKVLYNFRNHPPRGATPIGGLTFDAMGNLFGTTTRGGAHNYGTVFEMVSQPDGSWTEKVLYSFKFDGKDGTNPVGGVAFDTSGTLYGTTRLGGPHNWGTVFRMRPGTNGKWTETVVYSFDVTDGASPTSGLVFDPAGSLYGTTIQGGSGSNCSFGCGTVFEITP